ncbi:MAG: J domain-containing protein, partial [Sphingomonadales bacterium]
ALMGFTGRLAGAIPFILGVFAIYDKVLKYRGKGPHAGKNEKVKRASGGQLTRDEAYEVLGLKPGASLTEIQVAYKKLMQKLHPDKEGNEYLARKVNQARDTLLDKK